MNKFIFIFFTLGLWCNHFDNLIIESNLNNQRPSEVINKIDSFLSSDNPEIFILSTLHDDLIKEEKKYAKDFKKSHALSSFRIKAIMWVQNKYMLDSLKADSSLYKMTKTRVRRYKKGLYLTRDYLEKILK